MFYMGANQQDCKVVAEIINKYILENGIKVCYDITCGGANIIAAINAEALYARDVSPTLIGLHQSLQFASAENLAPPLNKENWDKCYSYYKKLLMQKSPRKTVQDYANYLKSLDCPWTLAGIGAIEWYGSFGHGGFSQGVAPTDKRDYYKEARMNHLEQFMNSNFWRVDFNTCDYQNAMIPEGAVIIAHINSSKPYQWSGKFEKFPFYRWTLTKSKTNPIFIIDDHPLIDIKKIKILKSGSLYFLSNI